MADAYRSVPNLLTIASWNVNVLNSRIPAVKYWISNTAWDIFCLQEVSSELLKILSKKDTGWEMIFTHESVLRWPTKDELPSYSVILARGSAKILRRQKIDFPKEPPRKLRSKIFIWLLSMIGIFHGAVEDPAFLYADVDVKGNVFRVFSTHFTLSNPAERSLQWNTLIEKIIFQASGNIVCGDFNIMETFVGALINYFLGATFRIRDFFETDRERIKREDMFKDWGFVNPLRGKTTSKSLAGNLQLDHILVPKGTFIWEAWVSDLDTRNRFNGSDHAMVQVTIRL
jgi:endonuclease/exonuclease/phosphatase family metal-dependent hydrolase